MHNILDGALIGAVTGGICGVGGVLVWALLMPAKGCPECDAPLPKFGRKHARPGFWGGWICPECGCEIDRKGNKVRSKKRRKRVQPSHD
jgi:hypothetical protein